MLKINASPRHCSPPLAVKFDRCGSTQHKFRLVPKYALRALKPRTLRRFPKEAPASRFGRGRAGLPGGHAVRCGRQRAGGQGGDQREIDFQSVRVHERRSANLSHIVPSFLSFEN